MTAIDAALDDGQRTWSAAELGAEVNSRRPTTSQRRARAFSRP